MGTVKVSNRHEVLPEKYFAGVSTYTHKRLLILQSLILDSGGTLRRALDSLDVPQAVTSKSAPFYHSP